MPDVGILQLSIQDNSEQAGKGLDQLADALGRVKAAVDGVKLSGISTHIEKIARAVNTYISENTIRMLGEFGDSLSKLNGIGDVNISLRGTNAVSAVRDSVQSAQESVASMQEGFAEIAPSVSEVTTEVQEFQSTVQDAKETVSDGINLNDVFDVSNLPFNRLGSDISEASREVAQFGAMAKDSFEIVQQMGSKALTDNFNEAETAIQEAKTSVTEMNSAVEETKKHTGRNKGCAGLFFH